MVRDLGEECSICRWAGWISSFSVIHFSGRHATEVVQGLCWDLLQSFSRSGVYDTAEAKNYEENRDDARV